MCHFTTYSIGLSGLCKNARSLYKVLYYVLSKAEAPKLLYFLLQPKYNFCCQNLSSKIKYNSKIVLHTFTNFTNFYKHMNQLLLKLSNIKDRKNLKLNCFTLYNTAPKNTYRSIYLMYHKWQENTLFSTWCDINVMKAHIHHISCSLRLFSYPESLGSCFSFLKCIFFYLTTVYLAVWQAPFQNSQNPMLLELIPKFFLLYSFCINCLFEILNVLFFLMITFLSNDIPQSLQQLFFPGKFLCHHP